MVRALAIIWGSIAAFVLVLIGGHTATQPVGGVLPAVLLFVCAALLTAVVVGLAADSVRMRPTVPNAPPQPLPRAPAATTGARSNRPATGAARSTAARPSAAAAPARRRVQPTQTP